MGGEYATVRLASGRSILVLPAIAVRRLGGSMFGSVEIRRGSEVKVVPGRHVRRPDAGEAREVARALLGIDGIAARGGQFLERVGVSFGHTPEVDELARVLLTRFEFVELDDDRGRPSGSVAAREPIHDLPAEPARAPTWVAVTVIDDDAPPRPLVGAQFRLRLPDQSTTTGALDGDGGARVDGIEPGTCWFEITDISREAPK